MLFSGGPMIKKLFKLSIALLLFLLPVMSLAETMGVFAQNQVTVEIHYSRPDGNYTGWNLWIWEPGREGRSYEFDEVGPYGAVARITLETRASEIGFIVRLNDWEQKDVDADRYIPVVDGKAIAFLKSGDSTVYDNSDYKKPEIIVVEGEILVNIHYRRYDNIYDGWNAWIWKEGSGGAAFPITSFDDFGAVISFAFDVTQVTEIGFIIRLNEWARKDVDLDRFMSVARSKNGVLNIYLLEGDRRIYYDLSEVDLSPRILRAKLDDVDTINVALTQPLVLSNTSVNQGFIVSDGQTQFAVQRVEQTNPIATQFNVILSEPLDLSKSYTISHPNYGTSSILLSGVFSTEAFEQVYHFDGELGALYSPTQTEFRLWAPTASSVSLNLFDSGHLGEAKQTIEMTRTLSPGVWSVVVSGDLHLTYFTYSVEVDGFVNEAVDPYARAVGVNGRRGMVVDLSRTNPEGWLDAPRPVDIPITDAIIYELHVRDMSVSPDSGITNKGKFLAFTERGTRGPNGVKTGVDHLVEMGITHLHLLPVFDFRSIDETTLENNRFNWGYDPQHFNVPEGSYSTDPFNGEVRINEFKQMVMSLHDAGIRVVMDVVYNHTGASADSDFSKIVPFYYYRFNDDGTFSNGSGTGNETASERSMVRKHFIDSVVYWATEYKIDGFRFDLMALHDIETMNMIRAALDEINPNILIYGEGWTGGPTPLPEQDQALKINASRLDRIAVFSDDIRDGLKGSVWRKDDRGFVNGRRAMEHTIRFGVVGSVQHPGVNLIQVRGAQRFWAREPYHTITYVESHDNNTLFDKLMMTNPEASESEIAQMHRLANAIVLTSQGIPFIHAGSEWMRTKFGNENSYESPDDINQLVWADKDRNINHVRYFQGLIQLRRQHPAFRLPTADLIREHLVFHDSAANTVMYTISDAPEETWSNITVLINGNEEATTFTLPDNGWVVVVNGEKAGVTSLARVRGDTITVEGRTLMVLVDATSYGGVDILAYVLVTSGLLVGVLAFIFRHKWIPKKA